MAVRRSPDRLVALGAIVRPHGVRGELRVHRFNPESTLLLERPTLWLRANEESEPRSVEVERARLHGNVVLLTLRDVRTREQAEALRGLEVCIPRKELPQLEEDEVYHTDLIGLRAQLADGTAVGEVVDVLRYPSADCLVVRAEEGDREVPMLPPYLVRIDLDAETVTVAYLEDLELLRRRS